MIQIHGHAEHRFYFHHLLWVQRYQLLLTLLGQIPEHGRGVAALGVEGTRLVRRGHCSHGECGGDTASAKGLLLVAGIYSALSLWKPGTGPQAVHSGGGFPSPKTDTTSVDGFTGTASITPLGNARPKPLQPALSSGLGLLPAAAEDAAHRLCGWGDAVLTRVSYGPRTSSRRQRCRRSGRWKEPAAPKPLPRARAAPPRR